MIKVLSCYSLPKIYYCYLNNVPVDSQEIKDLMKNSITQNNLYFNTTKVSQIDCCKYFDALKAAAAKTSDQLHVYYTNLNSYEFCELIKASKHIMQLFFHYDTIPFDYEMDFGDNMNDCKINYISLRYSGGATYSNWAANPIRFENFVASISKCAPLVKSLKTLNIGDCDIVKDKAQVVLTKYKLNGITLQGV